MAWLTCVLDWIENHEGLAAWMQAVFSLLAIVWATLISRMQFSDAQKLSLRQFNDAQLLQAQQRHAEKLAMIEVIQTLGQIATNVVAYAATHLRDPNRIRDIAEGRLHFDLDSLRDYERQFNAIPIHRLPTEIVPYAFMVGGTVRQVREKAQNALESRGRMTEDEYGALSESITGLQLSLHRTNAEIVAEVNRLRADVPNRLNQGV